MSELKPLFQIAALCPQKIHTTPAICQIAQEFGRATGMDSDFGMVVLSMLSPGGSLYGLAVAHPRYTPWLLAPWIVKTVLEQQAELRAALRLTPDDALKAGQTLSRVLMTMARQAEYARLLIPAGFTGDTVLLRENPVLYAHWHIGHSEIAEHLAVITQQAVVARLNQLGSMETAERVPHIQKYLRVPIRIASQFRAEDWTPYQRVEVLPDWVELGQQVIRRFDNYATLSASTQETYADNWRAFVLASPAGKKFRRCTSQPILPDEERPHKSQARPSRQYAWPVSRPKVRAPAKLIVPDEKEFLAQPDVKTYLAEAEETERERAVAVRPFTRAAGRGYRKDGRVPEMVTHPSRRSPGVWTPRLCALQLEAMGQEFKSALAYWRQRVLLNLHVHTGLSSAVIETLAVAHQEPARSDEWLYLPEEGRICVRPSIFLGRPPDLQPEFVKESDERGPNRRGGHRPVSDCLSIHLPVWLVEEINYYLHLLKQLNIGKQSETDSPLALFWPPGLAALPDFALSFHEVLARLHQHISARIPELVEFSAGQAAVTFEGLYAAGLDPIHRYYINHRKCKHLLLPQWYACVSAAELATRYETASQAVWKEIQAEWKHLRAGAATPEPDHRVQFQRLPVRDIWYGNFHCPEPELVHNIVHQLQQEDRAPIWAGQSLHEEEIRHNRRMETAAFLMLSLTGLRPFELGRLTAASLDQMDMSLAAEGKAHRTGGMGRVLPIHPGWSRELVELVQPKGPEAQPTIFSIYDRPGRRCPIESGHLQTLVDELAQTAGHASFDVYGLRVLYRSELLSRGIAFDISNYLMGHQSAGGELFNLRLENRWGEVVAAANTVAEALAAKYGWRFARP